MIPIPIANKLIFFQTAAYPSLRLVFVFFVHVLAGLAIIKLNYSKYGTRARIFYSDLESLQPGELQQVEINNDTKRTFVRQTIIVVLITIGVEVLDAKLLVRTFTSTILLDYFSTYVAKVIELIIYFQIHHKLYLLLRYSESINDNLRTSFISHKIVRPNIVEAYTQDHAKLCDLMNDIDDLHGWHIAHLWRCAITRFINSLGQIIIFYNSLYSLLENEVSPKIFVLLKLSNSLLYCIETAHNTTKQKGKWSDEEIKNAVTAEISNETSAREAAERFRVPGSTLGNHLKAIKMGDAPGPERSSCNMESGDQSKIRFLLHPLIKMNYWRKKVTEVKKQVAVKRKLEKDAKKDEICSKGRKLGASQLSKIADEDDTTNKKRQKKLDCGGNKETIEHNTTFIICLESFEEE
ncbi:hypothetical protein ILUMI_18550 [Ignelater luminosus]|uniref:HTH psq-type domain-containing protein n=1 Tax=Ignelater luminosus TaxID=2038154 RepID=A0A8K0G6S0_IGNLU|nr:hypothetical protein ILUMI_18550 [Ignelater luminosus]